MLLRVKSRTWWKLPLITGPALLTRCALNIACDVLIYFLQSKRFKLYFCIIFDVSIQIQELSWCIALVLKQLFCFLWTGRAKQRKAQLGTPERRPSCPHHCGRLSEPCWDQTQESHWGGQETPSPCGEWFVSLCPLGVVFETRFLLLNVSSGKITRFTSTNPSHGNVA